MVVYIYILFIEGLESLESGCGSVFSVDTTKEQDMSGEKCERSLY